MVAEVAQPGKLVPLAHVPGDEQQDASQDRQWNVQRQRRAHQHDQRQRDRVHHARHRRCRARADVCDGAGNRASRGHAAKKRYHHVGHALRHEFLVGVVLFMVRVGRQLVGHARAQQRFDGTQQRNGQRRGDQQAHCFPRKGG